MSCVVVTAPRHWTPANDAPDAGSLARFGWVRSGTVRSVAPASRLACWQHKPLCGGADAAVHTNVEAPQVSRNGRLSDRQRRDPRALDRAPDAARKETMEAFEAELGAIDEVIEAGALTGHRKR
jgi:hypothetical protein